MPDGDRVPGGRHRPACALDSRAAPRARLRRALDLVSPRATPPLAATAEPSPPKGTGILGHGESFSGNRGHFPITSPTMANREQHKEKKNKKKPLKTKAEKRAEKIARKNSPK